MSGTAAVSMPSLGSVEVTLGKVDTDGTVRSKGLVVKGGNFVSLDMTVTGDIRIGPVVAYTRNLNFTYVEDTKIFTMSGSAGLVMPVGVVEVTLGKVDLDGTVRSRGLIVKDGNFVSLDATVNSAFYVGGCIVYTRNLNFTYVTSTETFTMSGSAGVVLPTAGYVDVTFGQVALDGTVLSRGLIVQSGNFVSLDMTLNSNLFINGVLFTTKNLNFTYVESTKVFTMTGSASVTLPVLASVEVIFGGGDTKGLVVTNGSLTSLDMTVNASVLGVGPYALGTAKMKFTYSATTQLFTMTGNAKIGLPELGGMSVTLGGNGSSGMVINTATNTLVSFDMTVNSDFSVAGLTFAKSNLKINYSDSDKTLTMSGTAGVNLYIQSFTATLGGTYTKPDGTTGTSAGLVVKNGQLDSLDFTITDNVGLAGVSLGSARLYVSYDGPNKTFDLIGTADMTLQAKLPSWAKTFMGLSGSGSVYLGSAKVVVHVEPGYSSQGDNTTTTANLPTGGFDFESPDESRMGNFDGSSYYLQIPNTGLDNFANGLSAGMWIYPNAAGNWARIFDFGNGAGSDNIIFARNGTSNTLTYSVRRGSNEQSLNATNALTLNTWQYISVSQQANGSTTIYKDGTAIATGNVQTPSNIARSNCYNGKSAWSGDALFSGSMNNFNIWNRAITASEVAAAKVNQLAGNESGLVASYTLSGYHYGVATSTWTFANGAGITSNSGGFTNSIQNAPQGTQAAFLQNQGCITTSAVTMTPGKKYAITFALAERSTDTVKNPVEVIMDGQSLGFFTPTGSSYVSYTTSAFKAAAGNHTLTFRGTINTGDSTAFVDNISINEQINQPTLTNTLSNPTPYINAVSLDGTNNGRIQLPSYGFNDFTQGLSAGLWVYPTSTSGWKSLFEFG
ncbi:MAG: LamG domain-containing protein, partial [bacterium]